MGHKHARKGASGAHRWWYCGMSVIESYNYVDESSEAADEGTAAHYLAAYVLQSRIDDGGKAVKAIDFLDVGTRIHVPDRMGYEEGELVRFVPSAEALHYHPTTVDEPMTGRIFEIDGDMVDAVDTYVQQVMMYDYDEYHVEVDLNIAWLTQEERDEGTADLIGIKMLDDGTILIGVHDFKYGKSPKGKVDAMNNEQMAMYGMAARREYEWMGEVSAFSLHIHQPRLNHHDRWSPAVGWIDDKQEFCIKQAVAIDNGEATYVPGDKICYWCPHLPFCEEAQTAVRECLIDFPVVETTGPRGGVTAKVVQGDHLNEAYAMVGQVERWAQATREAAHRQVEDHPDTMPDWKMVAGKQLRYYSDRAGAEDWMKRSKFKAEDYAPPQFQSPAQLRKLCGKKYYDEHLAQFIDKKAGAPGIVHVSDPKPATTKHGEVDFPDMDKEDDSWM